MTNFRSLSLKSGVLPKVVCFKMKNILLSLFACAILTATGFAQEQKQYAIITVAFYNMENLFDFEDDPLTFDNDRTPDGKDHWTQEMYQAKLKNMAQVISEIGAEESGGPPVIIGLCEIENRQVLEDLVNQPSLIKTDYGIIQFDSPDWRGIDVALLYQKRLFTLTNYKSVPLYIYDSLDPSKRVFTRDQLVVSGMLDGELIHVLVNHWPSRRGGEARSSPKRVRAAKLNRHLIDSLFSRDPYAKIITMGDFNDDPTNRSIKKHLRTKNKRADLKLKELYNPMERLFKKGIGTLAWRDNWNLFDQIIVSTELTLQDYDSYRLFKAGIFNKPYLANPKGQFKGYPFRSFNNGSFTGGYSDHFPVYLFLIKEKN